MKLQENEILPAVLIAVTALPGGMFWRQNSGVFRTLDGRRVVRASAVGVADILGCYRGHAVAIETKTLAGEQRRSQHRFQRKWQIAGGIYIVARSVNDALRGLADVG
jgi:hypothetical protein